MSEAKSKLNRWHFKVKKYDNLNYQMIIFLPEQLGAKKCHTVNLHFQWTTSVEAISSDNKLNLFVTNRVHHYKKHSTNWKSQNPQQIGF